MNIDRPIFLKRTFAFSGGNSGRCYSLPTNPQVSAVTEPAGRTAPSDSADHTDPPGGDTVPLPASRVTEPAC